MKLNRNWQKCNQIILFYCKWEFVAPFIEIPPLKLLWRATFLVKWVKHLNLECLLSSYFSVANAFLFIDQTIIMCGCIFVALVKFCMSQPWTSAYFPFSAFFFCKYHFVCKRCIDFGSKCRLDVQRQQLQAKWAKWFNQSVHLSELWPFVCVDIRGRTFKYYATKDRILSFAHL